MQNNPHKELAEAREQLKKIKKLAVRAAAAEETLRENPQEGIAQAAQVIAFAESIAPGLLDTILPKGREQTAPNPEAQAAAELKRQRRRIRNIKNCKY